MSTERERIRNRTNGRPERGAYRRFKSAATALGWYPTRVELKGFTGFPDVILFANPKDYVAPGIVRPPAYVEMKAVLRLPTPDNPTIRVPWNGAAQPVALMSLAALGHTSGVLMRLGEQRHRDQRNFDGAAARFIAHNAEHPEQIDHDDDAGVQDTLRVWVWIKAEASAEWVRSITKNPIDLYSDSTADELGVDGTRALRPSAMLVVQRHEAEAGQLERWLRADVLPHWKTSSVALNSDIAMTAQSGKFADLDLHADRRRAIDGAPERRAQKALKVHSAGALFKQLLREEGRVPATGVKRKGAL